MVGITLNSKEQSKKHKPALGLDFMFMAHPWRLIIFRSYGIPSLRDSSPFQLIAINSDSFIRFEDEVELECIQMKKGKETFQIRMSKFINKLKINIKIFFIYIYIFASLLYTLTKKGE